MILKEGLTHTNRLTVTKTQTAQVIDPDDSPVLATPAALTLMENAAMPAMANELEEEQTTVDRHISSSHLEPSKVGAMIEAMVTLAEVSHRRLFFHVVAKQDGEVIGEDDHLHFVIDKQYFMQG